MSLCLAHPDPDRAPGLVLLTVRGAVVKPRDPWYDGPPDTEVRVDHLIAVLRMLAAEPAVFRVVCEIDSPGGTSAMMADLGQACAELAAAKPVSVSVGTCAASLGYYIACRLTGPEGVAPRDVSVSPTGCVGSVGVISLVDDTSVMMDRAGVKTHVIKTGAKKGGPIAGVPVAEADLDFQRRWTAQQYVHFIDAVSAARGLSAETIHALDGDMLTAGEALAAGLVDRVETSADHIRRVAAYREGHRQ